MGGISLRRTRDHDPPNPDRTARRAKTLARRSSPTALRGTAVVRGAHHLPSGWDSLKLAAGDSINVILATLRSSGGEWATSPWMNPCTPNYCVPVALSRHGAVHSPRSAGRRASLHQTSRRRMAGRHGLSHGGTSWSPILGPLLGVVLRPSKIMANNEVPDENCSITSVSDGSHRWNRHGRR